MVVSSRRLMALFILLLNCDCVLLGALCAGFKLGRQADWRPRCNQDSVVKLIDGTVMWQ